MTLCWCASLPKHGELVGAVAWAAQIGITARKPDGQCVLVPSLQDVVDKAFSGSLEAPQIGRLPLLITEKHAAASKQAIKVNAKHLPASVVDHEQYLVPRLHLHLENYCAEHKVNPQRVPVWVPVPDHIAAAAIGNRHAAACSPSVDVNSEHLQAGGDQCAANKLQTAEGCGRTTHSIPTDTNAAATRTSHHAAAAACSPSMIANIQHLPAGVVNHDQRCDTHNKMQSPQTVAAQWQRQQS